MTERVILQEEKKGDWKTVALFWGGVIVAVTSGSAVVAAAGVVIMGVGAWAWWRARREAVETAEEIIKEGCK